MKFTVPVAYTIIGWVEVEAETRAEAKKKAEELEEKGNLAVEDLNQSDTSLEVFQDEIEPMREEPPALPTKGRKKS